MAISIMNTKPEQACMVTQINIDNAKTAPIKQRKPTGFINIIRSAINTEGINFVPQQYLGKGRPGELVPGQTCPTIRLDYRLPYCEDGVVGDCTVNVCDVTAPDSTEKDRYLNVEIAQCSERSGVVTKDDFRCLCEGSSTRLSDEVMRAAYSMRHEINKAGIEAMYAELDNYSDDDPSFGATTRSLALINPNGHINGAVWAGVNQEFRRLLHQGEVMFVGGDVLAQYFDVLRFGGMGQNALGVNPAILDSQPFVYDVDFDIKLQTIAGDANSHAYAFAPGAFQMLEWYENTGEFEESFEDHLATTIVIDGWRFDYFLHYDKCNSVWTWQLKKYYDWGSIPKAAYCDNRGQLLHYYISCAEPTCATILQ